VQKKKSQCVPDDRMNGIPVLNVKKITSLAEDFLFVVPLNAQPLFKVYLANPFQQQVMGSLIDGA
jgi:hypothetical protein